MEALRPDDPRRLGPYRLRGRLGEGGMGEVFLGVSPSGLRAAVKTVRPEYAHDPGFRDRFRHEVAAARRVDSAWTAPIAEADPDSDPPWLATEYLTGIPLQDAVTTYGPLPERAVRVLAAQLVEALMAIHRAGLVHRDLKPSNVILGRDRPRVIDFGISRAMDFATHTLTTPGSAVGSPGYMAPEQATSGDVDERTDIFALGGVLVFAATGHTPFGRTPQNVMQLLYQIIQGEPRLDDVPEGLRDLIARCLAKDPADRPALAEILRLTTGDADTTEAAVGGTWLPAALTAELIRRQNANPADALPTAVTPPRTSPDRGDELPAATARNGSDGVTEALPADRIAVGPTPLPAPALPEPRAADDVPTHVLGAGDGRTRVAPEMTRVIEPSTDGTPNGTAPGTTAPGGPADDATPGGTAPRRGGLSRRNFLIGGAVAGVGAIGGATGWLLTRGDDTPKPPQVWTSPAGQVTSADSVVVGTTLCVVGSGVDDDESPVSGTVVALNAATGERQWQRSTAARHVGKPVTNGRTVFVLAWTDEDSGKSDTRQCTVYAFAIADGRELWKYEFPGTAAYLPQSVPDAQDSTLVLSLGPKSESSSDTSTGRIVALNADTGAQKWEFRLPSATPQPTAAALHGNRVLVSCQPTSWSSSQAGVVRVFDIAGDGRELWSWTAPEENWCWPAVPGGDAVFVRFGTSSTGSAYDDDRTLVALPATAEGPAVKPLWRTTGLPAGWGPNPVVDPAGEVVIVLTQGDDSSWETVTPWIQAFDATNGGLRWAKQPKEFNVSEPTIHESTLYVACRPSEKQSGTRDSEATSTPTAAPSAPEGGFVRGGAVYAYNISAGTLLWRYEVPRPGNLTRPYVVGDTVCVAVSGSGTRNATAIGIDKDTGLHRWSADGPAPRVSGPARSDKLFHVVTSPAKDAETRDATAVAFRADARSEPVPMTDSASPVALPGKATPPRAVARWFSRTTP